MSELLPSEYVLERCASCTLVWQRFAPSEALLTELYEVWAGDDGGVRRQDNLAHLRSIAEEVLLALELVGSRPSEVTTLDFGMGWGRWAATASAFGCRSYGVELSGPMIEFAERRGVTPTTLEDLEDAQFDFVNCEQVLEHLVDPRHVLDRLSHSLKPGGWIKINVPEGRDIERRLRHADWAAPRRSAHSLVAVAPLEHLNCFTTKALETLAGHTGLRRAQPGIAAMYAATIGLWPPRRIARGVVRPPLRRLAPRAAPSRGRTTPGAYFFRRDRV